MMDEKKAIMWVSRYALSNGKVSQREGRISDHWFVLNYQYLRIGVDAHYTESEAINAAEQRRVKKVASLRKQIAKFEKMSFKSEAKR